ncbi:hypothetical protein SAMN05216302_10271 [Nitrosomonas aestuarii]|uniref:Uncharacterized protein n=1 Tax=Nitrosomonas aestuarii TaxID=52441 RepID=A0A1I4EA71_9PROT|nr:hypothetical protein [Nitrosomonas aestuarii]SFL02655.1 hypothetical protein SAMN05216302_10271 [Nitrosomonas aestuarii]
MANSIDGKEIQAMVSHWLKTPVNGYLGSDYGQDIKSILQSPLSEGTAEAQIQKLRADVAVLQVLPENSTNLYSVKTAPDKVELIIEVAGQAIEVPEG